MAVAKTYTRWLSSQLLVEEELDDDDEPDDVSGWHVGICERPRPRPRARPEPCPRRLKTADTPNALLALADIVPSTATATTSFGSDRAAHF